MKRMRRLFFVTVALVFMAGICRAAGPPVVLTHTLTGYTEGETKVTADYYLHVENRGNAPVPELTLSLVPSVPTFLQPTTINLGELGPRETRDLFVQVESSIRLKRATLSQSPLFWAGTFVDADGKAVEFPIKSTPGGAK